MDKKTAAKNLQDAQGRLDDLAASQRKAGIRSETNDYLKANQDVINAEEQAKAAGVPWWKR